MAAFFKIKVLDDATEDDLGLVRVKTGSLQPTFAQVQEEIEGDELISGPFEFVEEQYMVTKKQEERWEINNQLIVRVKRSACDVEETLPPAKRLHSTPIGQANCEAQLDTTCKLSSKLLSKNVLEKWQQECERVRTKLKEMVVSRDDKFELHTEDFNGEPLVRIWCHECGVLYGKGSIEGNQAAYNCCSNFMRTHILESTRHEMKYMVARGLRKEDMPKVANQPQKDDKKDIEAAVEKLHSLMITNEGWDFEVIDATLHDFKDKRCVRVRCKYDDKWLHLCPPKSDLYSILYEHTKSNPHTRAVEKREISSKPLLTGLPGRPRKDKEHDPKQRSLSHYMVSTKSASPTMVSLMRQSELSILTSIMASCERAFGLLDKHTLQSSRFLEDWFWENDN